MTGPTSPTATAPATLVQACAPFFLYLTTFRRNAGTSTQDVQALRASLVQELERVKDRCEGDAVLRKLFEEVRYPLVVTADQVVLTSPWPHRAGWSMQLFEAATFGSMQGGKKFFHAMDKVLADPSDGAVQVAEVLFHCMGIGFQGELRGEKDELSKRRRQLFEKARLPGSIGDQLTPAAYGRNVAKSTLKLPTVGILRFVIAAVGALLFTLLAGNAVTAFKNRGLNERIDTVIETLDPER